MFLGIELQELHARLVDIVHSASKQTTVWSHIVGMRFYELIFARSLAHLLQFDNSIVAITVLTIEVYPLVYYRHHIPHLSVPEHIVLSDHLCLSLNEGAHTHHDRY